MFPTEAVPDRIGSYKVIRRLSPAGFADVYLGRMEGPMGFRRVCALKLVANSLEGDVRLAEELAREAAICARLNHGAIVRMFDFFEFDRRLVLVLEHVEGADLERLLQHLGRRRQKLGDEAIWHIGHQLVGALAHAHAASDEEGNLAPVVHRNLAPENILIGWDGQVRLAGFGLGKILGRSPDTVVGVIKGTPGYMAPEQSRGERVTPRADVYGFGILLWSLLSGRVPPLNGMRPEPISSLRPDIPREIAAAIEAALEPSADRRKITCTEIENWLEKITKVDAGRAELKEKILLLRSSRSPVGEGTVETTAASRPTTKPAARRRLSIRALHAPQPSIHPIARSATPRPSKPPSGPRSQAPRSERSMGPYAGVDVDVRAPPLPRFTTPPPASVPPEAPPSFAPPVSAPSSVAPRGLASQPPPPFAMGASSFEASALTAHAAPPPDLAEPSTSFGEPSQGPQAAAVREPPSGPARSRPSRFAAIASRPLTAAQSIGVAALTAGIVVGVGILVAERGSRSAPVSPSPALLVIPIPGSAPRTDTPPPSSGNARPPGPPTGDAANLPGGFGYLTVRSPVNAAVYVNGHRVGQVNQPLQALCGRRFVRLGTPNEAGPPFWVAPGQTVVIPCQGSIQVDAKPAPSPPSRSNRKQR
jgi:eukaryotic-like serine/threonine-protein kinase